MKKMIPKILFRQYLILKKKSPNKNEQVILIELVEFYLSKFHNGNRFYIEAVIGDELKFRGDTEEEANQNLQVLIEKLLIADLEERMKQFFLSKGEEIQKEKLEIKKRVNNAYEEVILNTKNNRSGFKEAFIMWTIIITIIVTILLNI